MSTVPQEFNWVEKRAACTVATVFNQVCDGIKRDVDSFNSVRSLAGEQVLSCGYSAKRPRHSYRTADARSTGHRDCWNPE